jgi:hypothetical protein
MKREEKIQKLIDCEMLRGFVTTDEYVNDNVCTHEDDFDFDLKKAYCRYEFDEEGVSFYIIKNIDDCTDCDFSQKWEDIDDEHLDIMLALIA